MEVLQLRHQADNIGRRDACIGYIATEAQRLFQTVGIACGNHAVDGKVGLRQLQVELAQLRTVPACFQTE